MCVVTQAGDLCSTEDVYFGHGCSVDIELRQAHYVDSDLVLSTGRQGRTQSDPYQPQVSVPLISRPVVGVQRGRDHSPTRSPVRFFL